MEETLRVGDGLVTIDEKLWIVYGIDAWVKVGTCKIVNVFKEEETNHKVVKLSVDTDLEGTVTLNVYVKDMYKFCFKEFENAEVKRVEHILCRTWEEEAQ